MPDFTPEMTFNLLKKSFKRICNENHHEYQNFQIRFHRSLSWYEKAIGFDPETQSDIRILLMWIAFNSIYASWDDTNGKPEPDAPARAAFLETMIKADIHKEVTRALQGLQDSLQEMFENKFTDPYYWHRPEGYTTLRGKASKAKDALKREDWVSVLEYTIERIALLRGQIVHGAATCNSHLNRESIGRCDKILSTLLPVILQVVLQHQAKADWPPLCYPPRED